MNAGVSDDAIVRIIERAERSTERQALDEGASELRAALAQYEHLEGMPLKAVERPTDEVRP